ncbi:hypothetical protein OIU84_008760 [Salix udensis]|uniref:NAC domain-containing protein n=1 Tax=Salix udensis TaxID=889485 RepID=A0AAD6JPT1_9ROSI|nr:hypothetical protein OIU84_008760 [Salix udensis]
MPCQGEIAFECPAMEFTEESKANVQVSFTTSGVSNSVSKPFKPSPSSLSSVNYPPPSPRVAGRDHLINPDNIDGDDDDGDNYFNSFPSGYRFCPHNHELVLHYLKNKVSGLPLPRNRIFDVSLYQHNPEELAEQYKHYGEREWYFFTPRDKKYRNGTRPNRAAGGGYWKATGADKKIIHDKAIVGYRKSLVYYNGKAPKGDKTNWMMHEFRVKDSAPPIRNNINDMRLDDWVLCRIYKKIGKPVKNREQCSTEKYQLPGGPNDPAAMDGGCSSGTDSWENPWRQQETSPLDGFDDAFLFFNSYSAAQIPILSETYEDPVPMLLSSDFSNGLPEEIWNPPLLQSDLAETFNLYSSTEYFPESITNLPAENLRTSPPPASTGLSASETTVETKAPELPQQLPFVSYV